MSLNNMRKLVFATNNEHKLCEAREIMQGDIEIVSLSEIGCHDEIPETADTLEGNALIKARWVAGKYGCPCFADDTGLFVDALDGAPGVMTARFAGNHCSPEDNIRLLLSEMEGKTNRKAEFRTVVAYSSPEREFTVEGVVAGEIPGERRGEGGFGYDPVFVASETGLSFAEMGQDGKNKISHRGRAIRRMLELLKEEK